MKPKNVLKTTTPLAIPGSYRHAVPGAKLLKKSDPGARIKVSIYARQNPTEPGKSPAPLEELNKQLPAERHYLKGEEFDSTFGANPADLEKIRDSAGPMCNPWTFVTWRPPNATRPAKRAPTRRPPWPIRFPEPSFQPM